MIYININSLEVAMLEFIGLTAIVYLLFMGVARLFRGKPPTRDIYIIREYKIIENEQEGHSEEQQESQPREEVLPDNVVPFNRDK